MKLKRSDKQYIEVEEFANYELTQCIAYEMAIRNKENLQELDTLIDYYDKNKIKIFDLSPATSYRFSDEYLELDKLIENIDFLSKDYVEERIDKEVSNIIKSISEFKTEMYPDDYGEPRIDKSEIIKRKSYIIQTHLTKYEEYTMVDSQDPLQIEEVVPSYYTTSGIEIAENFKRPKFIIDPMKSLNAKVKLDLNRPLDELLAYITHIKNDLEQNKDVLKAPLELFHRQLQKADNLVCNDKGKCFDPRKVLSTQQKMADMFFIYDSLELGYTQTKIRNEVYNYYADKSIDSITLDPATLRKYRDIAVDYIDNKRYKEMITGISINALMS